MRELWVGLTTARPMPAPVRASSITHSTVAMPVSTPKIAQIAAPSTAMLHRGRRSA